MPKVTMDSKEIIEIIEQFSKESSKENKDILEKILNKINEQNQEITELKNELTNLRKDLESGKFGVSGGGNSSNSTPSPDQTGGGPIEDQKKDKEWNNFFSAGNITDPSEQALWKKT